MSFPNHLTATDLTSDETRAFRARRMRKGDHALAVSERRARTAQREKVAAFFTREDHEAFSFALAVKARGGDQEARLAYTILTVTGPVPTRRSGFVAVSPSAGNAAILARALRSRHVDGFCVGLARLDELAGRERPAGRPVDMAPCDLIGSIAKVEAVADAGGIDAPRATRVAALLREATIHRSLARVSVQHADDAGDIADALHSAGAFRSIANRFALIAGRPGFSPSA